MPDRTEGDRARQEADQQQQAAKRFQNARDQHQRAQPALRRRARSREAEQFLGAVGDEQQRRHDAQRTAGLRTHRWTDFQAFGFPSMHAGPGRRVTISAPGAPGNRPSCRTISAAGSRRLRLVADPAGRGARHEGRPTSGPPGRGAWPASSATSSPTFPASPPCRPSSRPTRRRGHAIARNPGMPLDLGFLESMRNVNRSALERRVAHADQAALDQGRQPGRLAAARRRAAWT